MPSDRILHDQIDVQDNQVLADFPINWAGAALLCRSDSTTDTTLTVDESDDGTTWNVVLLSTPTLAGLPAVIITGLSFVVVLFVSIKRYVRISAASNNAPIYCSLVQYPPRERENAAGYGV